MKNWIWIRFWKLMDFKKPETSETWLFLPLSCRAFLAKASQCNDATDLCCSCSIKDFVSSRRRILLFSDINFSTPSCHWILPYCSMYNFLIFRNTIFIVLWAISLKQCYSHWIVLVYTVDSPHFQPVKRTSVVAFPTEKFKSFIFLKFSRRNYS